MHPLRISSFLFAVLIIAALALLNKGFVYYCEVFCPQVSADIAAKSGWTIATTSAIPGPYQEIGVAISVSSPNTGAQPTFNCWSAQAKQLRLGAQVKLGKRWDKCYLPTGCLALYTIDGQLIE